MIRIKKSKAVPSILATTGVALQKELCDLFKANPIDYTAQGKRPFRKLPIDRDVYGDASVKKQLMDEQHHKCCFCEEKFSKNSPGDVEHFRPKGAYNKGTKTGLSYPGYYWLAYDWNNLMFSCEICNRSKKRSHFPLEDEKTRVRNHKGRGKLSKEKPLLINPVKENPSKFIQFREEVVVAKKYNRRGIASIKYYGLDRFEPERRDHLQAVRANIVFSRLTPEKVQLEIPNTTLAEARKFIELAQQFVDSAAKNESKFAQCVRDNFPELPR